MAGRSRSGHALDQFRLALDENCSMPDAADRLAHRDEQASIAKARAREAEAMRRLRAKGWRG